MLVLLSCTCGGTENLLRKTLQGAKGVDWLNTPIYKGGEKCRQYLASLPQNIRELHQVKALDATLSHTSRFAIVFAYNDTDCRWVNIKAGSMKDKLDAQILAEDFS